MINEIKKHIKKKDEENLDNKTVRMKELENLSSLFLRLEYLA